MQKAEYRKALRTARNDLERMFREREELERKIARMRDTVISLGLMVEHDPKYSSATYIPATLTEACQHTIVASKVPLEPSDIRRRVERIGFDIGSSNPLASVYSVLNRLVQQKVIRRVYRRNPDGTYIRMHHFWWGDDDKLPKGWVAPTKDEFDADLRKDVKQINASHAEMFDEITKKLARRAKPKSRRKVASEDAK